VEEVVLAYFKVINRHSVGVAEGNHEKPQLLSNEISLSELARSFLLVFCLKRMVIE
jgi:hypothetical protein